MLSASAPNLLVVDSGIGGMSVVLSLREILSSAHVTYLADHGGFPYGMLNDATLTTRLLELIKHAIIQYKPHIVVLACNTASTIALPALRQNLSIPIVGCVPPIKPAAQLTKTRCIGLLATEATVRRPYIQDLATRFAADCRLFSWGSANLAILAEARFRGETVSLAELNIELRKLLDQPNEAAIDTIVLGCTHYAFLLPELQQLAPHIQHWLDPADPVARQVYNVASKLPDHALAIPASARFLTTAALPLATIQRLHDFGFHDVEMLKITA